MCEPRVARHFFGRALGDEMPAGLAAFGAQIDDVVGGAHDVEIVLDHEHRVALVHQLAEHVEQFLDVFEMQPGRRLVEDVQRAAGAALRQFSRQLHALRFPARQRRRRLSELDVAEADFLERAQLVRDRRHVLEQRKRLIDGEVQHVGDRFAAIANLERLAVVPPSFALLTRDVHVRQEVHRDRDDTVALARFAAPAFHVEREAARLEAALAGIGQHREQLANEREEAACKSRGSIAACGRLATDRSR